MEPLTMQVTVRTGTFISGAALVRSGVIDVRLRGQFAVLIDPRDPAIATWETPPDGLGSDRQALAAA